MIFISATLSLFVRDHLRHMGLNGLRVLVRPEMKLFSDLYLPVNVGVASQNEIKVSEHSLVMAEYNNSDGFHL